MGYYTSYKLEAFDNTTNEDVDLSNIFSKTSVEENHPCGSCGCSKPETVEKFNYEFINYAIYVNGGSCDAAKWYDHEKDLKALSKKYPYFRFELSGEGEESGDIWKKYFINGKMQAVQAKIIFESFDPKA